MKDLKRKSELQGKNNLSHLVAKPKAFLGRPLVIPPLSDIFFKDPHDITRYFAIWYDYHTILAIFYDAWSVQNLSKKKGKMRDVHE